MPRFEVTLVLPDGGQEIVMVWADASAIAIKDAVDWLDWMGRRGTHSFIPSARQVGDRPEPGDLNVARSSHEVDHRAFSSRGEELSVPERPSIAEIARATGELHGNPGGQWKAFREELRRAGIVVEKAALFAPVATGQQYPPAAGVVISRPGDVFVFHLEEGQDPGGLVGTVNVKRIDAHGFAEEVKAAIGLLSDEEEQVHRKDIDN